MSISVEDVLKINMVLLGVELLADDSAQSQFTRAVGTEATLGTIMQGTFPATPLPSDIATGRSIALERDRITIALTPDRAVIERQYPEYDSLQRLSEVIDLTLQSTRSTGISPRAFGYNAELVYSQTSEMNAEQYLATRLFPRSQISHPGWELVGAASRLIFQDSVSRWTVNLDKRVNDPTGKNVFLGLNLHKPDSRFPEQPEILQALQDLWKQGHELPVRIDEGDNDADI